MYCPISTVPDRDVTDNGLLHIDKGKHMWAWIKISDGLQFVGIIQFFAHEGDSVSVYFSCTGNGYLF